MFIKVKIRHCFRYFLDPLDDGEKNSPVSTKTLIKTQDVRSLVTNQNKLLDNLGGMKRDIGNLDQEIDVIRSQIRSTAVINDVTSGAKPQVSKTSSKSNASSRRSSLYASSGSSTKPSSIRTTSSRAPTARPSYGGITRLPVVETSRIQYSLGGTGVLSYASAIGAAINSTALAGGYVPGSYIARKTSGGGHMITKHTTVPRTSSVPPSTRARYVPVGTVTVTTRPRTYTTYRRPVYLDDWDDMDETAIGTYLNSSSRPPHIGTFTNRIFDSLRTSSSLYQ